MIPETIQQVSSAWLSEVLGVAVADFTATRIGEGVGLMGEIFRVALEFAGDAGAIPPSVVVKLPSNHPGNREQGVALGMYEAEVRFYNEVVPEADVAAGLPAVYHAAVVPGSANFVVVMEDLTGFKMVDQLEGMSAAEAHATVRVLADLHAVWWGKVRDVENLAWIPTQISARIEFVDQLIPQILPGFLEHFGAALPPGGADLYQRFAGNYLKINQALAERSPWTLAHQDFRIENLLYGNHRVVVIDWQGIGLGPGAYDLAYCLGGSMEVALRRSAEEALVTTYHQRLLRQGVTGYSFEQLWDDYGHAMLMGGLATAIVTGGTFDLTDERSKALMTKMATRHVSAALDHDGHKRLDALLG